MFKPPEIKYDLSQTEFWVWFIQKTVRFDNDDNDPKPIGWHWFWGLYYLRGGFKNFDFDFEKILDGLPDGHWLKIEEKEAYTTQKGFSPVYLSPIKRDERHKSLLYWVNSFSKENRTEKINFSNMTFRPCVDFSKFIFPVDTDFSNSKFLEGAKFVNTIFFETADFRGAEFHGETAKFRNTDFKKIADFSSSRFKGYANFKGSKFGGRTSFQKTIFEHHAPRFYGAEFNNEMTFFGMIPPKFEKICYEKNEEESETDYDKRIGENQNSYENTAILLEEKKKYHDQHLFYRAEMRCRQWLERKAPIRWAFWLYEKLANYGYGIERAAIAWLLHIFIGIFVIVFIAMCGGIRYHESLSCAIPVSFTNANPYALFSFDSVKLAECYDMFNKHAPILFAIIKVIQTILGVGLLFLVLLTLRVRFRLK